MAILVEGISVVVRNQAVLDKYEGGVEKFAADMPHVAFCSDGELTCVSFMAPTDVKTYVALLERRRLRYVENGAAVDIAVADQRSGLLAASEWMGFGRANWDNDPERPIAVCFAIPTRVEGVVVPETWSFEGSLSERHRFVETDKLPCALKLIRREPNVDVYFDEHEGREYYVVRPVGIKSEEETTTAR